MRHVNPNMVRPVLAGIQLGEALAAQPSADTEAIVANNVVEAERLHTELLVRPTGRFLLASRQAFAQGVVAGYNP